jgi:hypothetical protein
VSELAQNGHAAPEPVTSGERTDPRNTVPHAAHRLGPRWAAKHTVASSTVSKASADRKKPAGLYSCREIMDISSFAHP